MGRDKFGLGLADLGHAVELMGEDRVVIPYQITEGRFAGQQIKVGIQVPADFEMTPPGGIHITPRLIPINLNAQDHSRAAESQPFGADYEYLSRPFQQWARKRTVKRYMEYVADLLNTL